MTKAFNAKVHIDTAPGEGNDFSLTTYGNVVFDGKSVFIDYSEEGARTCIGVSDDTITINRTSDLTYTMVLEKDSRSFFTLISPQGKLDVSVIPLEMIVDSQSSHYNLSVTYELKYSKSEAIVSHLNLKCQYL